MEIVIVYNAHQNTILLIRDFGTRFDKISNKLFVAKEKKKLMRDSLTYMENLASTLSGYRNFFLRYFHWLNHKGSKKSWRQALDGFMIEVAKHNAHYKGNHYFPAYNFTEAFRLIDYAHKTNLSIWCARLWLVVSFVWLWFFFKSVKSVTSLPVTAREYWFAGGLFLVYAAVSSLIFSGFRGVVFTALLVILAMIYVVFGFLFFKTKDRKALFCQFLPGVLLSMLLLSFVAIKGPLYFWFNFWTCIPARSVFIFLFIFIIVGSYIWLAQTQYSRNTGGAIFATLFIAGLQLTVLGAIILVSGLNEVITQINNELVVLPYFLTLIHGIVTHLNIPSQLPWGIVGFGLILLAFCGPRCALNTSIQKLFSRKP